MDTNVLLTCGRFHGALGLARDLSASGARVDIADSYALSPALHSKAVDRSHIIASPAGDPVGFAKDVARIARERDIELIVPTFEGGFYLANYADLIPATLFAPPFEIIRRLHDKARFVEYCHALGIRTPDTLVVDSQDALRDAVAKFENFVARPAYSRGGLTYLTNHGPRAGENTVEDCQPTSENPWLVQDYIEGDDACTLSVARHGEVVLHCAYEPSIAAPGGFSVQFTSIADAAVLDIVSAICRDLNYTGFIGFDYRRTSDGLVMIECNPRTGPGVFLMPQGWVSEAVIGSPTGLMEVEPGISRQYDAFMLNRHLVN
ncbi:MAG: ATP-grasp domain-containing protein, partial [Pseudomonadota bacterium]